MNGLYRHDLDISSGRGGGPLSIFDPPRGDEHAPLTIAGVDEAGRGPLAGPVVAAAVILDLAAPIDGINDSKKLTPARRDALYAQITSNAVAYAVGMAAPEEIDRVNILQATFLAMARAIEKLNARYGLLLIDGNQYIPTIPRGVQQTITSGDSKSASVAAASIIAKVTRDRIMAEYHEKYPLYNFAKHKGYGTKLHREMIALHGACDIHRRSFLNAGKS
ncbi:MAG: ribonuclease HII [Chitinispirillales bacterium]|jgi:ribonuclease HII|nr:ribonuclease HII [Chitinispirillales bacterium]